MEGLPTNTERRVLGMVLGGPVASCFLLDGSGQEFLLLGHLLLCGRCRVDDVAQIRDLRRFVDL